MPSLHHKALRYAFTRLYPLPRGEGRIIERTPLGRLRFPEQTMQVTTRDGVVLEILPNDYIGRIIYLTGRFDPAVTELLVRLARPGDRLLDIGANIGSVSATLLRRVPGTRVVAVEPVARLFRMLTRNLAPYGDRAGAICAAVSDRRGTGAMRLDGRNSGASSLVQAGGMHGAVADGDHEVVAMLTPDDLLAASGLDGVDLIKIDVEGHEATILAAMMPLIRAHRPRAILFEHRGDPQGAPASGAPAEAPGTHLAAAGYRLYGIRRGMAGAFTALARAVVPLSSLPARQRSRLTDHLALRADLSLERALGHARDGDDGAET